MSLLSKFRRLQKRLQFIQQEMKRTTDETKLETLDERSNQLIEELSGLREAIIKNQSE